MTLSRILKWIWLKMVVLLWPISTSLLVLKERIIFNILLSFHFATLCFLIWLLSIILWLELLIHWFPFMSCLNRILGVLAPLHIYVSLSVLWVLSLEWSIYIWSILTLLLVGQVTLLGLGALDGIVRFLIPAVHYITWHWIWLMVWCVLDHDNLLLPVLFRVLSMLLVKLLCARILHNPTCSCKIGHDLIILLIDLFLAHNGLLL